MSDVAALRPIAPARVPYAPSVRPSAAPRDRTWGAATARHPWVAYGVLFVLLAMTTSWVWNYTPQQWSDKLGTRLTTVEAGNFTRRLAMPVVAAIGCYWIRRHGGLRRFRLRGVLPRLCVALFGFVTLSVAATQDPAMSVRKYGVLVMLIVGVLGAALRLAPAQMPAAAVVIGVGSLLGGLASELTNHLFTPWTAEYRFAGIFHPNLMAAHLSVAFLGSLAWARMAADPRERQRLLAVAAVSFVFLFLTKSRTAFGAALLGAAALLAFTSRPTRVLGWALGIGVAASLLTLVFGEQVFARVHDAALMGRGGEAATGSLSNRIPLWTECLEWIARRPLTGYGYGAFWSPQRTMAISAHQGWVVPHAHNSYIEMTLGIGVLGGAAYVGMMLALIGRMWRRAAATRAVPEAFALAVVLYFASNMLLEAFDFDPNGPTFIYLVLLAQATLWRQHVGSAATTSVGTP